MSFKLVLFFLTCAALVGIGTADIFGDLFKWDIVSALTGVDPEEDSAKREEEETTAPGQCDCEGKRCTCCVDFNISSIMDLGGPGCVNMRYISQSEGIALNVSYGDSVLHSQTVTDKTKKGTCMQLLSDFAQICARFASLTPTDDGLAGCLNFEPTVFGQVTSQYLVGCFKMSPNGMVVDQAGSTEEAEEEEEEEEEEETDESTKQTTPESTNKPEEEAQSFIEAVNQSAEDGLSFFSDLLGLSFKSKKKNKTANATTTTAEETPSTTEALRKRKGKFGVYNNVL